MTDFVKILPGDIINEGLKGVKCVDPDELMLFEFREQEMLGSGIVLLSVSTQKFNQVDVIPKWRVLAIGDNVEKEIGVKRGDMVIVHRLAGRYRELDTVGVRFVKHTDVLAKVIHEQEDFEDYIKKFYKS